MNTQLDIVKFIKLGEIDNELDFERALIADRKLRLLSKKDSKFKALRIKLRRLIEAYEYKHWSAASVIDESRLLESDLAEALAEKERQFIERRKGLIKIKLKQLGLSQQDFGKILGHHTKSYISELINGIRPFSLKDLIVINRLLKIDLTDLVPTFLPLTERIKIRTSFEKLQHPKLHLGTDDFALSSS